MVDTSIIIPTQASVKRAQSLLRAIESVTSRQENSAVPIVVVNGTDYDPELVARLKSNAKIRFFQRPEGNLAKARHFGRKQVDSRYFGFLDDDDEHLPGTLQCRTAPLSANPTVAASVTNGIRNLSGEEEPYVADMAAAALDPVGSLMSENWLASCGGLFRTDSVGLEFFPDDVQYLEWTYTALRMALTRRIEFVDRPAFVVHDTPMSLSKSQAYHDEHPRAIQRMLTLELPRAIRRELRIKLSQALHSLSDRYRCEGYREAAWAFHVRSLGHPGGLMRYGLYTRKLVWASLWRRPRESACVDRVR